MLHLCLINIVNDMNQNEAVMGAFVLVDGQGTYLASFLNHHCLKHYQYYNDRIVKDASCWMN